MPDDKKIDVTRIAPPVLVETDAQDVVHRRSGLPRVWSLQIAVRDLLWQITRH